MEIQSECLVRKNTTECFVGESYLVYEDVKVSQFPAIIFLIDLHTE